MKKKKIIVIAVIAVASLAVVLLGEFVIIPHLEYKKANELYLEGKYMEAEEIFSRLYCYNSQDMAKLSKYDRAMELLEEGNATEANILLKELGSLMEAESYVMDTEGAYETNLIESANTGDVVTFGVYEMNSDGLDIWEPLEWIVLEKREDRALLISKLALFNSAFTLGDDEVDAWEESYLRIQLNDGFYNFAFMPSEQERILETEVIPETYPGYDTDPGNPTKDKVFILSVSEIEKYFPTNESRICEPNPASARYHGGDAEYGVCKWWTRTSGGEHNYHTYVKYDGSFFNYGSNSGSWVRPCIWVTLD